MGDLGVGAFLGKAELLEDPGRGFPMKNNDNYFFIKTKQKI